MYVHPRYIRNSSHYFSSFSFYSLDDSLIQLFEVALVHLFNRGLARYCQFTLFQKHYVSSMLLAPVAVAPAAVNGDLLAPPELGHCQAQPGGGARPHPDHVAAIAS
jgi:hypothetical protein